MLFSRTLLFIYPVCNSLHLLIPNSQSIPLPRSPPWQPQVCPLYLWVCFLFVDVYLCHILDSTCKWYFMTLIFLISLSMIMSRSIHVIADGIICVFNGWVVFHYIYTTWRFPFLILSQTPCIFLVLHKPPGSQFYKLRFDPGRSDMRSYGDVFVGDASTNCAPHQAASTLRLPLPLPWQRVLRSYPLTSACL